MHTNTATVPTADPPALDQAQLAHLARTFEHCTPPVWIHDTQNRCLYRNFPAMCSPTRDEQLMIFEIVNHQDRVVGHLTSGKSD